MSPSHVPSPHAPTDLLLPASVWPRFKRGFGWYVRRLLRKSFHAIHVAPCPPSGNAPAIPSHTLLADAAGDPAPLLVLLNHQSWWDPLLSFHLAQEFVPERFGLAPMDLSQLRKFKFFTKLGIFGVDPDNPASLHAMGDYLAQQFRDNPRPSLWITPQGRFVDVRQDIELRPGAAALAARLTREQATPRVICLAIEYVFWTQQTPEICLRFTHAPAPADPTRTAAWHRAMVDAMQHNAAALAALTTTRDPAHFTPILGGSSAATHPVYDAWLRLRGKTTHIEDRQLNPTPTRNLPPEPAASPTRSSHTLSSQGAAR